MSVINKGGARHKLLYHQWKTDFTDFPPHFWCQMIACPSAFDLIPHPARRTPTSTPTSPFTVIMASAVIPL